MNSNDLNNDLIPVQCTCGHHLGKFQAWDDHGTIEMECPKCKEIVLIHSQELWYDHTTCDEEGHSPERTPEQPLIVRAATALPLTLKSPDTQPVVVYHRTIPPSR